MSKVTFTMIGSGAVRVNPNRGGPAQLVQTADNLMLFDCGRCAVHNIERFGFNVQDIDHLFLTHLHFDHICDLPYFLLLSWNNGRQIPLTLYGPEGLQHFMNHALWQAYKRDIASRIGHGKSVNGLKYAAHEFGDERFSLNLNGIELSALRTDHGGIENYNYRLNTDAGGLVITSDTQPTPELIPFCRDAELLVCECSGTEAFLQQKPWGHWHMTPERVAELATKAGVKRVMIKHLVIEDFSDDAEVCENMAKTISQNFDGEVMVGSDGMQVTLG